MRFEIPSQQIHPWGSGLLVQYHRTSPSWDACLFQLSVLAGKKGTRYPQLKDNAGETMLIYHDPIYDIKWRAKKSLPGCLVMDMRRTLDVTFQYLEA